MPAAMASSAFRPVQSQSASASSSGALRMRAVSSSSKIQRTLGGLDVLDDMGMEMDRGRTAAHENRWVFEVAWEVANKGERRGEGRGWGRPGQGQG